MNAQPKITVLGEALIDLIDGGASPYAAHAGGSPLNVAVGCGRLGLPTAFLGRLSRDPLGTVLRRHAARSGVDLSRTVTVGEPTTVALVELTAGTAQYEFSVDGTADFQWQPAELAHPSGPGLLHFGSLTSWLPPGAAVVDEFLARVRTAGQTLISYDPNVRPALQPDPVAAREQVERSLARAHLVKASEQDTQWLYPDRELPWVAEWWLEHGPELVVITRGDRGAVAFAAGRPALYQPARSVSVIDTIGAGDAFTSGLLHGLVRRSVRRPGDLRAVIDDPEAIRAVLDGAALVAAMTCSRPGADPPWLAELPTTA